MWCCKFLLLLAEHAYGLQHTWLEAFASLLHQLATVAIRQTARYMNKIDFSTISTDRLLLRFVRRSDSQKHPVGFTEHAGALQVELELYRRRQLGHISKDVLLFTRLSSVQSMAGDRAKQARRVGTQVVLHGLLTTALWHFMLMSHQRFGCTS